MTPIPLDVETTTTCKGNPFTRVNKLVCIGIGDKVFYEEQFTEALEYFNSIKSESLFIGVNFKFDLHWLRNVGFDISNIKVWDCQLAEFLIENQTTPYPSLNGMADKYGLPKKLDVVKLEYWDKGIDTDKIPREILSDYLLQDLKLTKLVFDEQYKQLRISDKYPLFRLQCQDLLVLEEMEYNGIVFDSKSALAKAEEIERELTEIYSEITNGYNGIPINLNSNEHVSCLLYGGVIKVEDRIPVGVYKSGAKVGHVRYKIEDRQFELPRLVEPIKGSELQKGGYWSTDDKTLRSLKLNKQAKRLVELLKRYSELEKLRSTYLLGWSKLIEKMDWKPNMIHGNLNQCVVITGRLSSTQPNLQNADPKTKTYCISRYDC